MTGSTCDYYELCRKQSLRAPKYNLFDNRDDQLVDADVKTFLAEGRLFLAKQLSNRGNYSDALELLNLIQSAEASFQTAMVTFASFSFERADTC